MKPLIARIVKGQTNNIAWAATMGDAQAAAQRTGKLIMVEIAEDWCGWSKRLERDLVTPSAVAKAVAGFVAFRPNNSMELDAIAERYAVQNYPTILFLEPNGALIERIEGYEPSEPFARRLRGIQAAYRSYLSLKAALRLRPNDINLIVRIAISYLQGGDNARAQAFIAGIEARREVTLTAAAYKRIGDGAFALRLWDAASDWYARAVVASDKPVRAYADAVLAHGGTVAVTETSRSGRDRRNGWFQALLHPAWWTASPKLSI